MAKNRTEKSKWESSYGGGFIATSQYISEKICQRKADQERRGRLPSFFWQDDKWKNFYKQQTTFAAKMIKEFGETALLKAFRRQDVSWCYSLASAKFRAAVYEEYQKEIKSKAVVYEDPKTEDIVVSAEPIGPVEHTVAAAKKNLKNLLDE